MQLTNESLNSANPQHTQLLLWVTYVHSKLV